jgi:predicted nucleic acid-binding protein
MIVLDTNVISAMMRPAPDPLVLCWLDKQPRASMWTTSITVFEIRFGLQTMPAGNRQSTMSTLFESWLNEVVRQRVAFFDDTAARQAAELAAQRQKSGRPGDLRDTMIAGIVLASRATLATRNVKHFEDIASSVVNPWTA